MRLFILLAALACSVTEGLELTPYFTEQEENTFVECGDVPADATPFAKTSSSCALGPIIYTEQDETPVADPLTTDKFPASKFVRLHIRTWSVSDSCNNKAQVSRTFHIYDTTSPTISGVIAELTENCDELAKACEPVAHDDCDANVTVTLDENNPFKDRGETGCQTYKIVRTYTATDDAGNSDSKVQTVTVQDNKPPEIFSQSGAALVAACSADVPCPDGQTCINGNCVLSLDCREYGGLKQTPAIAVDNCDPSVTVGYTVKTDESYGNNCVFGEIRTYSAEDNCGHTHTVVQSVTYTDNHDPELGPVSNEGVHVNCDNVAAPCPPPVSDACDALFDDRTTSLTIDSKRVGKGDCEYDIEYTYTATDHCGRTSSKTQTIHVADKEAPKFTYLPPEGIINLECEEPNYPEPSAVDNCGCVTMTTVKTTDDRKSSDPSDFNNFQVVYTYTATDECGLYNTSSHTVNVQDTRNPDLGVVPDDQAEYCHMTAVSPPTASDECCFNRLVTETETDWCPSTGVLQVDTVTYTAVDCVGRTASDSFTNTITDSNENNGVYSPILTNLEGVYDADDINVFVQYSQEAVNSYKEKYEATHDTKHFSVTPGCLVFNISVDTTEEEGDCNNDFVLLFTYSLVLKEGDDQNPVDPVQQGLIGNKDQHNGDCYRTTTVTRRIRFRDTTAPDCVEEQDLLLDCGEFCDHDDYKPASMTKTCGTYTGPITAIPVNECEDFDGCDDCTTTYSYTVGDDCGNEKSHSWKVTFKKQQQRNPNWICEDPDAQDCKVVGAELDCVAVLYTQTVMDNTDCACEASIRHRATTDCGGVRQKYEPFIPGDFCPKGDPSPTATCPDGWEETYDVDNVLTTCTKYIDKCKSDEAGIKGELPPDTDAVKDTFSDKRCTCTEKVDASAALALSANTATFTQTPCGAFAEKTFTARDCSYNSVSVTYKVVTNEPTVSITPQDYTPACGDGCPAVDATVRVYFPGTPDDDDCSVTQYGYGSSLAGALVALDGTCELADNPKVSFTFTADSLHGCPTKTAEKDYPIELDFRVGVTVGDQTYTCEAPEDKSEWPQPVYTHKCIFGSDDGSDDPNNAACLSYKKCTAVNKPDGDEPNGWIKGGCVHQHKTIFTISNLFGETDSATRTVKVEPGPFTWNGKESTSNNLPAQQSECEPPSNSPTAEMCGNSFGSTEVEFTLDPTTSACNAVGSEGLFRKYVYNRVYTVAPDASLDFGECVGDDFADPISQTVTVTVPHPTVAFQNNLADEYKCTQTVDTSARTGGGCLDVCPSSLSSESEPTCTEIGESQVTHTIKHMATLPADDIEYLGTDGSTASGFCGAVVASVFHSYDVVTTHDDVTYSFDLTSTGGTVTVGALPGACAIQITKGCDVAPTKDSDDDCCTYPTASCSIDICGWSDSDNSGEEYNTDPYRECNPTTHSPPVDDLEYTCFQQDTQFPDGYSAPDGGDYFVAGEPTISGDACEAVEYTTEYSRKQNSDDCDIYEEKTITHTVGAPAQVDVSIGDLTKECGEAFDFPMWTQVPKDVCVGFEYQTTSSTEGSPECPAQGAAGYNAKCVDVRTRTYVVEDGCTSETVTTTVTIVDTEPPVWDNSYNDISDEHKGACPLESGDSESQWDDIPTPTGTDKCNVEYDYDYTQDYQDCSCTFTRTSGLTDGIHRLTKTETITHTTCTNHVFKNGGTTVTALPDVYVYQSEVGGCKAAAAAEKAAITAYYGCTVTGVGVNSQLAGVNSQLAVDEDGESCKNVADGESCTYTWTIRANQCTTGTITQTFYCNHVDIDDLTINCEDGDRTSVLGSGEDHIGHVREQLKQDKASADSALEVNVELNLDHTPTVVSESCVDAYSVEFKYDWDENGGQSSGSVMLTVNVVDNHPPTWGDTSHLYNGQTLTTGADGDCTFVENKVQATDLCDDCVEVFETYTETPQGEGCFTKYTKTYTGYDNCGASTSTLHESWYAGDKTAPAITLQVSATDTTEFDKTKYDNYVCEPHEAYAVAHDHCDADVSVPKPGKDEDCASTKFTYTVEDDCENDYSEEYTLTRAIAKHKGGTVEFLLWTDWTDTITVEDCFGSDCTPGTYTPAVEYICGDKKVTVTGGHLVCDDGADPPNAATAKACPINRFKRTYTASSSDGCFTEVRTQKITFASPTPVPTYDCESVLGVVANDPNSKYDPATNTLVVTIDGTTASAQDCEPDGIPNPVDSCCEFLHEVVTDQGVDEFCLDPTQPRGQNENRRKVVWYTFQIVHKLGEVNGPLCTLRYDIEDTAGPTFYDVTDEEQACDYPNAPTVTAADTFCGVDSEITVTVESVVDGVFTPETSEKVYTYKATDACGVETQKSLTLTKFDRANPEITVSGGAGGCKEHEAPTACASDNCPGVVLEQLVSLTELDGHSDACPDYEVVYTWVATDQVNGKTATESRTLRVEDNVPPTFADTNQWFVERSSCSDDYNNLPKPVTDGLDCHTVDVTLEGSVVSHCVGLPDGRIAAKHTVQTWRATDACNNYVEKTRTIVVINTAPVITKPTLNFKGQTCLYTLTAADFTGSTVADADGCPAPAGGWNVQVGFTQTHEDCYDSYTVTYDVKDACGLAAPQVTDSGSLPYPSSGTVIWDAVPADPFMLDCEREAQTELDGSVKVQVLRCDGSYTDESKKANIYQKTEIVHDTPECDDKKISLVQTWAYELLDTCHIYPGDTFEVHFTDTTPPTLTPFTDQNYDCNNDPNVPQWARPGASTPIPHPKVEDNCDANVEVCYTSSVVEECVDGFQHVVTYTATDHACNEDGFSFTVTVDDTTDPVLSTRDGSPLPENAEVDCEYTPEDLLVDDNCGGELSATRTEQDVQPLGVDELSKTEYTYSAVDSCGNSVSHTHTITVVDKEDPVLNGDFDEQVNGGECVEDVPYPTITVSDNCGCASYLMTETVTVEGCVTTIVRTWVATDSNGRTSSRTQTITFEDDTLPQITIDKSNSDPKDCTDGEKPPVFRVTDNCRADPSADYSDEGAPLVKVEKTDESINDYEEGTITWTITVQDDCGNEASETVHHVYKDTTDPTITAPSEATTEFDCLTEIGSIPSDEAWALQIINGDNGGSVQDDCTENPSVVVTQTIIPGECGCDYQIKYTATATDGSEAANTATASWVVTVSPKTECGTFTFTDWARAASNAFNADPSTLWETEEDPGRADVSFEDPYSESDLAVHQSTKEVTASLDANKPCNYQIEYTFAVEDECGLECDTKFTIQVSDKTEPELYPEPESPLYVECDAVPEPCDVKAYDDCGDLEIDTVDSQVIHTSGPLVAHCKGRPLSDVCYTIVRTWTAEDQADNSKSITQTIYVSDNNAPSFAPAFDPDEDKELYVECDAHCDELGIPVEIKVTDNCEDTLELCYGSAACGGDALYSETNTFDADADNGLVTDRFERTYYAADKSGNAKSFTQTITIRDTKAPVLFVNGSRVEAGASVEVTLQCPYELNKFDAIPYAVFDECNEQATVTTEISDGSGNTWDSFRSVSEPNKCDNGAYTVVTTASDGKHDTTYTTSVTYSDTTAPKAARSTVNVMCPVSKLFLSDIAALAGIHDNCHDEVNLAFKSSGCASASGGALIEFNDTSSASCAVDFTAADGCNNEATLTITFARQCAA